MEQFSLEKWLKDKSRKVVTRHGKPVRIVCWDRKCDFPIIALEECDNREFVNFVTSNGRIDLSCLDDNHDLFFEDKEIITSHFIEELEEYLKNTPKEQIEKDWKKIQDWHSQHFTNKKYNEEEELTEFEKAVQNILNEPHFQDIEAVKQLSNELLDLARNELEKENSEFKPKFTYNEKDYSELANKLIEFRNNTPLCSVSYRDGDGRKIILHYEKEILDLTRKELEKEYRIIDKDDSNWEYGYKQSKQDTEKDLPKLEKSNACIDPTIPVMYTNAASMKTYVEYDGYKLCINDAFEKLSKEE